MINYETMKQHLSHKIAEYDKEIEELEKLGDSEVANAFNKIRATMCQMHKLVVDEVLTWVERHNN